MNYSVLNGAESFFLQGNEIGLLISHGFMGTPQSVQYIGNQLSKLGYTVYAPRLSGHGTHYQDMARFSHQNWLADLEQGYHFLKERCSRIYVMGQSMGGALAIRLAKKYHDIEGLALINPALSVPAYEQFRDKMSPAYIEESSPDIKCSNVHEITYDQVSLHSIQQLLDVMEIAKQEIPSVTAPILCFKAAEDHVVPPVCSDYIIKHTSSEQKELVTLHNSYHVASMDYDKDVIVNRTHQFIIRNEKARGLIKAGA